jgi:hypothetical protein
MLHTRGLNDTGSVGTGVVRKTTSVSNSRGHLECLMVKMLHQKKLDGSKCTEC